MQADRSRVEQHSSVRLSLRDGFVAALRKLFLVGVPPHTGDRHVQVPAKNGPLLSGMLESLIGPIDEAIEVMERSRDAG